jgi:hypothetical protein
MLQKCDLAISSAVESYDKEGQDLDYHFEVAVRALKDYDRDHLRG